PRPALKSINKMGSLELACAKARIRDRRSEDTVDQTLILRSSSRASTRTSSSTTAATPTAIASKRLREDVEKDVPRKRASIIVAQRASSVTDSSCDTSITSDEIVTPDMSSLPPSSPQSVACQVPFPSDSGATKELVKKASLPVEVEVREDPLHGLAPLEANAAMVLASLFGGL
ncbi:11545_t:CDS:2, partial [Acaulospora colombiana]